jgi:uncharacterized tellurite resistance protein B-like protein
MLKSILDWFKTEEKEHPVSPKETAQKAASALMIEVVLADSSFDESEKNKILDVLKAETGLTTQECLELVSIAEAEVDHATSLHQFTRHLNKVFDLSEKLELVHTLWKIAYADGHLDKHEEHIIRKIADLLHLRHSEFMQAKHKAQDGRK